MSQDNAIAWSDNLNRALNTIDAVDTFVSIMRQRRAVCNPAEWEELNLAIEECKTALDKMRKQVYAIQAIQEGKVKIEGGELVIKNGIASSTPLRLVSAYLKGEIDTEVVKFMEEQPLSFIMQMALRRLSKEQFKALQEWCDSYKPKLPIYDIDALAEAEYPDNPLTTLGRERNGYKRGYAAAIEHEATIYADSDKLKNVLEYVSTAFETDDYIGHREVAKQAKELLNHNNI